jgi:hypothetical protein
MTCHLADVAGAIVVLLAAWHVLTLLYVFASRLTYPMDLEWIEGGTLYVAYRFMRGQPVYTALDQGFLPFPYPPLYTVIVGSVGRLVGLDYWTGRAISALSFVLVCVVLGRAVYLRGGSRRTAIPLAAAAVAMCAAGYPVVGGWYDVGRIDSMALAWPVLAAGIVDGERITRGRALAAALVMTAALYTKQNAIIYVAWIHLFVLMRDWRRSPQMGLATGCLCLVPLLILQATTKGWFWYWLFAMGDQRVDRARAWEGLWTLLAFAPQLFGVPSLFLLAFLGRRLSASSVLWTGMLASGVVAGLLAYMVPAGYLNNLIPPVVLAGPVTLLVAADALPGVRVSPSRAALAWTLVFALIAGWLLYARYDVGPFLPSRAQWRQARDMDALVRELPGGVLVPNHPFVAVHAGKNTPQFHTMTYWDAWSGRRAGLDLMSYLQRTDASWAILDGTEGVPGEQVARLFEEVRVLEDTPKMFTGYATHMRHLLQRRPPKRNSRIVFDFESGRYDGWQVSGEAFGPGPTAAARPNQGLIMGHEGHYLANSFDPEQADTAVGRLVSPPFVIDRDHLAVLVGGGARPATRVELQIDGRTVYQASGFNSEFLREVSWDVRVHRGRLARILVIDEDTRPWGHILADHIVLFDRDR